MIFKVFSVNVTRAAKNCWGAVTFVSLSKKKSQ